MHTGSCLDHSVRSYKYLDTVIQTIQAAEMSNLGGDLRMVYRGWLPANIGIQRTAICVAGVIR
jgi:hypothetical protein